ncbi:MAG TPA: hypothetical protein VK963_02210 [Candidatus Saccharimonadales bacterium]|nr:hypothetical protein [Candidatus Saccharimonadales bacterium]
MASTENPQPVRILRPQVDPVEIAKYYLTVALTKLFEPGMAPEMRQAIAARVAQLEGEELWRLIEAFSVARGLNDIFWYLSKETFSWSEEDWDASQIVLTGMAPAIDRVMCSEAVNRSPLKFRDYLRTYFQQHPDDDPDGLGVFRPSGRPIIYRHIFLRESDGRVLMLDGSHRLMELLLNGEDRVLAFVGRGDPAGKTKIGPSVFRLLRLVYQQKPAEGILQTVKQLMAASSDGAQAVQTYWVEHVRDEEIKQVGRKLLQETKEEHSS